MTAASTRSARRRVRAALEHPGLPPRLERWFDALLGLMLLLFSVGWGVAIAAAAARPEAAAPMLGRAVTANPLSPSSAPDLAYLLDAAIAGTAKLPAYHGYSGAVDVVVQKPGQPVPLPDSLPPGTRVTYAPAAGAPGDTAPPAITPPAATPQPASPGVWNLLVRLGDAVRQVPDLSVITLVPLSAKHGGRIGRYVVGSWPYENGGTPRTPAYAPPAGLVRVTPENMDTKLSEHIRLRDFLTKGQAGVWPKYVAMSPRVVDKVELTIQELNREGYAVSDIGVISGFRTPTYNATGGNTEGRAQLSRHMYGDAMDVYVDSDHNGCMDDLNHDGKVDIRDARIVGRAAEKVEQEYPSLVGGIGVYAPTSAHCGFVHIDTRGYRARWGPW